MPSTGHRAKSSTGKSMTIKPPGSNVTRVSVACDRCRKKKIRCFYDDDDKDFKDGEARPCANCKAVGLECNFTDKLARKAFPRGYTESLEERVRELEYENKKLQKLIELKSDGTETQSDVKAEVKVGPRDSSGEPSSSASPSNRRSSLNNDTMSLSSQQQRILTPPSPSESAHVLSCGHVHEDGCTCGYAHSIHNRPVSIAGSVDIDRGELSDDDVSLYSVTPSETYPVTATVDDLRSRYGYNSFEQANAPGAAAAISLQNKLRTKNFMNLANLIAASIPRSTEETLFIPALLARVVSVHGFGSRAPILTARSIALMKELPDESLRYSQFPITFKGVNFHGMKREESIQFFQSLNLPNYINLDLCVTVFFDTWNTVIPVLNKEIFMSNYVKFNKSRGQNFQDGGMISFEKFGELLVIITALVMLSHERNNSSQTKDKKNSSNAEILQFYDHMIKQFTQSNLNSICSISSLQMITIELLYCLTTGDLNTSYELRGKMVTMTQQLRMQRCPAAVLGFNGSNVSKIQQGERRILFWCTYTLDAFSAFTLGVPRLFKDYEIECALPSSSSSDKENKDSDINMITFNNIQLSLVGKVCDSALSVMRYARILGTIVDTIFKRSNNNLKKPSVDESSCLVLEEMLDSWRRDMPATVSFSRLDISGKLADYERLNDTQLTLLYLYYQAKALIYMPLMASEAHSSTKNSPAFISIQQATTAILTIAKVLSSPKHNYYYLPLPMNLSRQKARFALLAAKGALEYTRGGALFQEAKNLLNFVVYDLKSENEINMLGCLSANCCTCLEHAIDAILSQPKPVSTSPPSHKSMQDRLLRKDARRRPSSPLRNVAADSNDENQHMGRRASDGGLGGVTVKKEPHDSTGALNDIFMSKPGYQMQTLQQQMRQPVQQQARGRSLSSAESTAGSLMQGYVKSSPHGGHVTTWNPDSMGSYKPDDVAALHPGYVQGGGGGVSSANMADGEGDMVGSKREQEDSLNAILEQVGVADAQQSGSYYPQQGSPNSQGDGSNGSNCSNGSNGSDLPHKMPMDSIKSFSDLLMLNDFGVDASLGMSLMDFELDTPNKRPRLDGNTPPKGPEFASYNSLFNWNKGS